jgi:addiction module HigA family antidote
MTQFQTFQKFQWFQSFKPRSAIMKLSQTSGLHPGIVLVENFLEPLGISQERLAKIIQVPPQRIGEIIAGKRSISAEIALRLAHSFGLSKRYWLNLQARYDATLEKEESRRNTERYCLVVVK